MAVIVHEVASICKPNNCSHIMLFGVNQLSGTFSGLQLYSILASQDGKCSFLPTNESQHHDAIGVWGDGTWEVQLLLYCLA